RRGRRRRRKRCGFSLCYRTRQGGGVTTPQSDRNDFVSLGSLKTEERDLAAGAERALHVSLRSLHVRVVHLPILPTHNDERLTTEESGRPFQRSLNEARVTGSSDGGTNEADAKGEGDCRNLHGGTPQTARGF